MTGGVTAEDAETAQRKGIIEKMSTSLCVLSGSAVNRNRMEKTT
jgi:hypothetical protein